jgi:hypothetical protein
MLTLTADELRELTGKVQAPKQRAWLEENGIPFHAEGRRILVSRANAERWLSGVPVKSRGFNWSAVA